MTQPTQHQKVLIVDFGSQVTQLIARRLREASVYCEIHPFQKAEGALAAMNPAAIILSGGPESVHEEGSPRAPQGVFEAGVPVLGICYGEMTMCEQLGGKVEGGHTREFGRAEITVQKASPLLADLAPVTRYTITERGRLSRELAGVRRHGYASTAEEMTMGTCSVAVPVADREGRVVAALGLVARNLRRDLVQHVPVLRVAAAAIDAVACAALARRCIDAPGDRWAVVGDAARGRIALAACPEMIERAGGTVPGADDGQDDADGSQDDGDENGSGSQNDADENGGSGVLVDSVADVNVTTSVASVPSSGSCKDAAGNEADGDSFGAVKVDGTKPTITATATSRMTSAVKERCSASSTGSRL